MPDEVGEQPQRQTRARVRPAPAALRRCRSRPPSGRRAAPAGWGPPRRGRSRSAAPGNVQRLDPEQHEPGRGEQRRRPSRSTPSSAARRGAACARRRARAASRATPPRAGRRRGRGFAVKSSRLRGSGSSVGLASLSRPRSVAAGRRARRRAAARARPLPSPRTVGRGDHAPVELLGEQSRGALRRRGVARGPLGAAWRVRSDRA